MHFCNALLIRMNIKLSSNKILVDQKRSKIDDIIIAVDIIDSIFKIWFENKMAYFCDSLIHAAT